MSNEYKLSYAASEIDAKLKEIGEHSSSIDKLSEDISNLKENGTSAVQPDWNQNDETAQDYIKNRPFYESDPVETNIVEETNVVLEEGRALLISSHGLEVEQEYIVVLDGTQYKSICKMHDVFGMPYIGNTSFLGGEDTQEPFFIAPLDSETELRIMIISDVLEHKVSVTVIQREIHKIDEKYLPSNVALLDEYGKYQVTVLDIERMFNDLGLYMMLYKQVNEGDLGAETISLPKDAWHNLDSTLGNIIGMGYRFLNFEGGQTLLRFLDEDENGNWGYALSLLTVTPILPDIGSYGYLHLYETHFRYDQTTEILTVTYYYSNSSFSSLKKPS